MFKSSQHSVGPANNKIVTEQIFEALNNNSYVLKEALIAKI